MSVTPPRTHDLVLFGATGFTGQLVAEYLATCKPLGAQGAPLRWALAGRNREKLEAVRARLATCDAGLAALPLLQADAQDEAALQRIAASTRAICTTAGPFAQLGGVLIGAAATQGTHYCDITGELTFIRSAIDQWHDVAVRTGAQLVPTCGFDSLPSDLGVLLLHRHFEERGLSLAEARLHVERIRGGASGGTLASMVALIDVARRDPAVRRLLGDPYALLPDRTRERGPDGGDLMGVRWDRDAQRWMAPFVMAAVNARVVRRSNALLDFAYGRDFRYSEVSSFARGPKGWARAVGLSAGLGVFLGLVSVPWTRALVMRRLPRPGEGPSAEERQQGGFVIRIRGRSRPDAKGQVHAATAVVEGHADPGYGETSKMLGEAALCLATDPRGERGGVLTPAVALGLPLVERLRRAGMGWRVEGA